MVDAASVLARRVLADNLRVRKGESVVIESWTHTLPYVRAMVAETRRLGGRPTVLYEDDAAWWDAVQHDQLGGFANLSAAEKGALEASDVYIHFWGPEDRPKLAGLPDKVQEKVMGYNEEWYRVARKSGVRGCRMLLGQATDPAAKRYALPGPAWRSRMIRAGSVDARRMQRQGQRIQERLATGKELRIRHSNGTDLTLQLAKVTSRVDSGLLDAAAMKRRYGMLANNPTGQVLAAIDGAEAEGTVATNRAVCLGFERFDGVRWTFAAGHLTRRTTGAGRATFERAYAKAGKGRDELGLVSIGLNPESRGLFPLEDTEAGAVLLGIGSNAFVGGRIHVPFQGYGLLGDATVEVDGQAIARGGQIVGAG